MSGSGDRAMGAGFNPFQGNYCFETLIAVAIDWESACVSIPSRATTALRRELQRLRSVGSETSFNPFQGNYCFET